MPGRSAKRVLNASIDAHQSAAASDLLTAVGELFPERFDELLAFGRDPAYHELDTPFGKLYDDLYDSVTLWTRENQISCSAVDEVATCIAAGLAPLRDSAPMFERNKKGDLVRIGPPPIHAEPFRETLDEFLDRARRHYKEVREAFKHRSYTERPVKRELDHFRYLAAHLIGGHSWEAIARGRTPFHFPTKSAKTVAGEARKAARLVGISLPNKPGPRLGSRVPHPHRAHR